MTKQLSFTKFEKEITPNLNEMLNQAESTEDARKFLFQNLRELFGKVFDGNVELRYEDVEVIPSVPDGYMLSARVLSMPEVQEVWEGSDLKNIVGRMARNTANRYKHLEGNPAKTEAKMFHGRDGKTPQ